MYDMEGTGVFAFRFLFVPMAGDRPPQPATLSIYRLPWCQQFCFWVDPGRRRDQFLHHLQQGFTLTGGVPDNLLLRAVRPFGVRPGPEVTWLKTFRRFCAHYRCHPRDFSRPVSARTPWFDNLYGIIRNTDWASLEQCQHEVTSLAAHLSQQKVPDLSALSPLPAQPFVAHDDTPGHVSADGFLRYKGDYYSMPPYYTGRTVWVRRPPADPLLRFYSEEENLITQHPLGPGQGRIYLRREHFGLTPPEQSELVRAWRSCFPEDERFLGHLLAQRKLGAPQTLRAILDLTKRFRRRRLREVFHLCEQYNNYSHRFIQGLLEADQNPPTAAPAPPAPCQELLF